MLSKDRINYENQDKQGGRRMKRYCVIIDDERLVGEIDETAVAQRISPEDLIVLLMQKAMAPWSKAARRLEGGEG